MAVEYYEGIGRRKATTARVRIATGTGQFSVNGKPLAEYFTRTGDKELILGTFRATGQSDAQIDVSVLVRGGGVSGQRDAVKLGLARALVKLFPDYQPVLKKGGFMTRDPRIKERKKPGLKRARKAPTYTKR